MSVLIKGMDMPKTCEECALGDSLHCQVLPSVPALWAEYTNAIREKRLHSDCPLVSVPPHGRLGDLDELEKSFREDADSEWNRFAAPVNWADAFDDAANIIADTPTIIPAEEEG